MDLPRRSSPQDPRQSSSRGASIGLCLRWLPIVGACALASFGAALCVASLVVTPHPPCARGGIVAAAQGRPSIATSQSDINAIQSAVVLRRMLPSLAERPRRLPSGRKGLAQPAATIEPLTRARALPDPEQHYSFKLHAPASLTYASAAPLCNHQEERDNILDAPPLSADIPALLVIGAQKAGTTWLWGALARHPAFVGAKTLDEEPADIKELEYFSQRVVTNVTTWYDHFASHATAPPGLEADLRARRRVLVDATPQYLKHPLAPPRVKQLIPHAKIVLLMRPGSGQIMSAEAPAAYWARVPAPLHHAHRTCLGAALEWDRDRSQDPVARAVSALKMYDWVKCERYGLVAGADCDARPAMADAVRADLAAIRANATRECFFGDQDGSRSWKDCFCAHEMSIERSFYIGNFAPTLAWWLSFFPPEQILLVRSQQLREPGGRVEVLNQVIEHAGLEGVEPFTEEMIAEERGFANRQGAGVPPSLAPLVPEMRALFARPAAELERLVNDFWPELGFTGLEEEI